jgi:hypothetical protein
MQFCALMRAISPIGRFRRPWLALVALGTLPVGGSFGATASTTQNLNALIHAIGKLSVPASVAMTPNVNKFSPFSASLPVSYRARSTSAGGGAITVRVTSDFSPTGGPSAAAAALTYTCASATLGTPCSGTQTASTILQTPVLTLPASACTGGGGACSAQDPNTVNLSFSLADDPGYATGSYSAKLTFTISAT